MDHSEYYCIKCLAEGDEEAFVALYNKYHSYLYYTALKLTQSEALAKDITQDVFLKIWETRATINPKDNFAAYIHVICRNRIVNLFKRATREEAIKNELYQFADEADQEDDDFYDHYRQLLDKAVELLPPQRRNIFILCKWQKKSYEDVARQFNISRSTVQDHIVKATKFIKDYLLSNPPNV